MQYSLNIDFICKILCLVTLPQNLRVVEPPHRNALNIDIRYIRLSVGRYCWMRLISFYELVNMLSLFFSYEGFRGGLSVSRL
jgi:hypothetical protein